MFTGIVQARGTLDRVDRKDGALSIRVSAPGFPDLSTGDSIAVNGVCLTVTGTVSGGFEADVSAATLETTTLGRLSGGDEVNLEPALTPSTPLGGHLVSGHVDGIGELVAHEPDGGSVRMRFRVPGALTRYIARKGSIGIDGVSLTVNEVVGDEFAVNVIPLTLEATTLGDLAPGTTVNIEVDQVARYLERLLERDS